jgi:hypothetical protein
LSIEEGKEGRRRPRIEEEKVKKVDEGKEG